MAGETSRMYDNDPFGDLGRLRDELFPRSYRLVVDTGIHAKRWTREQAIAYMRGETGNGRERRKSESNATSSHLVRRAPTK